MRITIDSMNKNQSVEFADAIIFSRSQIRIAEAARSNAFIKRFDEMFHLFRAMYYQLKQIIIKNSEMSLSGLSQILHSLDFVELLILQKCDFGSLTSNEMATFLLNTTNIPEIRFMSTPEGFYEMVLETLNLFDLKQKWIVFGSRYFVELMLIEARRHVD